jgi:uroporphyrinogen decarboxylase
MQHTIPHGTVQDVRDEVRHLIEQCGVGGGFVLAPSNALLPEYPIENIVAMYAPQGVTP